jgi:hypothetical protein
VKKYLLIAFDIDDSFILSVIMMGSTDLSFVDSISLDLFLITSANRSGVVGFFLFLRTE